MPRFQKVSTLFDTSYGILALLSFLIVTFSAARFLVQHYLDKTGVFMGIGSHPVGFLDILITIIFLMLVSNTFFEYDDTWRDKLIYGAKLLVCYGLCFVVTDFVMPALAGKRSVMFASGDAQDNLKLFIIVGIPSVIFWFFLSPHTAYVYDRNASAEPTLERGARTVAFETLREVGSQKSGQENKEPSASEKTARPMRPLNKVNKAKPEVKSKRIRIIETPEGYAPKDIRKCWIGVEFTLEPQYEKPEKLGGITVYQVDATVALKTLRGRSPRAASWWEKNAPDLFEPGGLLGFSVEACAVILDGEVKTVVAEAETSGPAQKDATEATFESDIPDESDLPDMRRYAAGRDTPKERE